MAQILDGQSCYWIYFNLLSTGTIWLLLFLEVVTAITPDLIIKVFETIRED